MTWISGCVWKCGVYHPCMAVLVIGSLMANHQTIPYLFTCQVKVSRFKQRTRPGRYRCRYALNSQTHTHTHTLERPSFDSHLLVIMEQAPKFLESRSQIRGNQSIIRVKSCDQIEVNQRNQLGCLFDSITWKNQACYWQEITVAWILTC